MAKGWRSLLEEESEHQWLAIGVFFVFVLFGAVAIGGTQNFVGDAASTRSVAHQGFSVLDISYSQTNSNYTALIFKPNDGFYFITEDVEAHQTALIYGPSSTNMASQIKFVREMPDGEILYSLAKNQLIGLFEGQMITYELPTLNGEFGILDVTEGEISGTNHQLVLTQEGTNTSFRGIPSTMIPTLPMATSSGVTWQGVHHLAGEIWVGYGSHTLSGTEGSSPASPQQRGAIGWIQWDGSSATPELTAVKALESGLVHSMVKTQEGVLFATPSEAIMVTHDGTSTTINQGSYKAVADTQGTVWFIGVQGSSIIASLNGGEIDTHELSHPIPVDASIAGYQDDFVFVHGTDVAGNPMTWEIDILANGSIESGRGFLNLLFLIAGGVVLTMMTATGIRQMINEE